MATLLSRKPLLTSLPRPPSSSPHSLSRLRSSRLAGGTRRLWPGVPRRIIARSRRKRLGRRDGREDMASSSRISPPPIWRSDNTSSVSITGYDEEEALHPAARVPDGIEMFPSTYKGGSLASFNALSVNEASGGDLQEKYSSTNLFQKNSSRMNAIKCFGVDLSPDNVAVAVVYFVQGVLGLARLAVSFYLKDDLRLDPAETAVISGFSSLPWLVKPLYGFISDSFPLFGYRRRSYLILSGLLGAFSWCLMATVVDNNTNKLGFTPEFLGRVKLVTSVASLVGVGIYNTFLKSVPLRKIFLGTTIIGSVLGMTQVLLVTGFNRELGMSDEWFAIGDSLIITVLSQASFMPVLVLAAKLCPAGMEATLFATLMSISNGGSVAGGLMGAGLTQILGITKDSFVNLALLITICNLSSLLPLPLLGLLPADIPEDKKSSDLEQIKLS
ncbi:hypothetical protein KSP39_PZI000505 [Platanthera zijinensis]|uniref:Folate-biopterin transporter 1, chloroplastic n=1 Tax=Platanthera zijinensis TaxID=2320716 RepID=A0AAP0GFH2_9ASPA